MGGLSIDGLVSGLDTTSLVNQLISLERNPQRRLQARQADLRNTVSNYTDLNARIKTIQKAAEELADAADWQVRSAFSSNEDVVSVSVTDSASPGTISFTVDALAATHIVASSNTITGLDGVAADGSDFTVNGVTITAAEYGGGTLEEVVAAINNADAGVSATAVQVSPGEYRLQMSADDSGAANTFTVGGTGLTTAMGTFGVVSQGADATITVGDGPGSYQVTSDENTFADVIPGLTFTAESLGTATVTVETDVETLADKVQALADAMNDVRTYIDDRRSYDSETGATGVFLGQTMPGELASGLINALVDPVNGSALVGRSVGLQTDRDGQVTFDREAFIEAYGADPDAVEGFFTTNDTADATDDGIAERLALFADDTTALTTGRLTSFIDGRNSQIEDLDDDIAQWDVRLELRERTLRRKFTNLETVLGRLQSQGQWLAGALASLPRPS